MKWAIAQGHRLDNPAGEVLGQVLGRQPEIRHHRALPYEEIPDALRTVWESNAAEVSKLAFEFLVLTAARSGEVRLARWNEMDLVERLWTIPAERMKMAREHRVPLSGRTLEILARARSRTGGSPSLVFPNARDNRLRLRHCPTCSRSWASEPCPMDFAPASMVGQPSEAMRPGKSLIWRWPT